MDCGASTAIRLYIHYFWADVGGAASWTFAAARFRFLRALSRALCFAEHDADRRAEGCWLPGAALAAAALLDDAAPLDDARAPSGVQFAPEPNFPRFVGVGVVAAAFSAASAASACASRSPFCAHVVGSGSAGSVSPMKA